MRFLPTAARVAAPLLAALTLAACQEPTGVGAGLIDDPSLPEAQAVPAATAAVGDAETTTAGFAASGSPQQTRVLVGSVVDALYGDATAVAYLDAALPAAGRPTNFQDSTITSVALQLRFDSYNPVGPDTSALYVYGNPTADLTVEVREVTEGWAPTDLAVNTTLPTGDVIATGTVTPTDTTFTLPLDAGWVAANADKIRSTEFLTDFEGFQVRVPDGTVAGAVRGFDATESAVLVYTPGDTLAFPVNEVLTSLTQGEAMTDDDIAALRAGRPQALALTFDFAPVGRAPIANAQVKVPIRRGGTGGTDFVRPLARQALLAGLGVAGLGADTTRTLLTTFAVPDDGDVLTNGSPEFISFIQDVLIQSRSFDRFEVTLPANPVSLDVLPVLVAPPAPQPGPRFSLTTVGRPS